MAQDIDPRVDSKSKGGTSGAPVTGKAQGALPVKRVRRKGMKKTRAVS